MKDKAWIMLEDGTPEEVEITGWDAMGIYAEINGDPDDEIIRSDLYDSRESVIAHAIKVKAHRVKWIATESCYGADLSKLPEQTKQWLSIAYNNSIPNE